MPLLGPKSLFFKLSTVINVPFFRPIVTNVPFIVIDVPLVVTDVPFSTLKPLFYAGSGAP